MSVGSFRRLTGVFNDTETRALREAYLLALHSLALTHSVDERLKSRLADSVLNIYMAQRVPEAQGVDTSGLAARSIERCLTFENLKRAGADATLH